jgi:signal transduction histidine kinase
MPPLDIQAVLNTLDRPVLVVGAEWRVLVINKAWERLFGRSAADCARRDLFSCFPAFAHEPASAMLRASREDGATRYLEIESPAEPEGVSFAARVARDATGLLVIEAAGERPAGQAASVRDARDEETTSLRMLARQMAAVADSTALLELLCRAASEQCGASGAAVLRVGATVGEVVSAAGDMAITVGRRFPLEGSVAKEVLQSRGVVVVENFTASLRPLARIMPELRIGPVLAAPLIAHDLSLGVLVVVRGERALAFTPEESQRLRVVADHAALAVWKAELLEQSQAADKAKGRFLATISHELRTPLTALTGYEELLADEVIGPLSDSQTDVLDRMRSVTHHLTVMIEEVLAYSSIEAGHEVVRPSEFLADDLVRAATAIIEPLARQKRLRLACDLPAAPIRMTSDIDKVRQIIVNLAGNAVKFTEAGEVRMTLSAFPANEQDATGPREVRFAVHDTGPGIAPDDVRLLFRPFAQLDTGLTRRHGGTGLGLYISHRLAGLLRGRIEVESEPGVGSTFTLALPSE